MALLQGEITYRAIEEAGRRLQSQGSGPSEEELLEELLRCGELSRSALEGVTRQVEDLERFMSDTSDRERHSTVALGHAVMEDQEPESGLERDRVTTARMLWATNPAGGRPTADNKSILSVLKLPRWNHYINLQFIGEGGMGRIFQAFDTSLRRQVALKFLRREDQELVRRLFLEAQHQAQVDHPNICKVYEVSEWHGQVYVAMQFIDGKTLAALSGSLKLEQKVRIMEVVAEAVHAAHRHGLVHRDLKPANIMVETSEEGGFKPYVLDFGLARDITTGAGETVEGSIMGTFHYMAPEQARGDIAHIERRTDVYALGASLYELLSANPPFAETKGLDCLRRIMEEEVPALRRLVPEVPADLETIVMRCLEKTIERRYESARALAEDLRRFLDGEPILARPVTLSYRLGKLVRKNKVVTALLAAALLVVLVFAALGIQARITAANRAQWAQYFGQEAERIEALLRYSRLQPAHDVRGELESVHARIRSMEQAVLQAGGNALGPGDYALGRAYLALGDLDQARIHLDHAWEKGFRDKAAAYARGRVLSLLFSRGLEQARSIQNPELRQSRIKELEEGLRDPAASLLSEGKGNLLEPANFQEGLLAFFAGRHEEAAAMAREAARTAPWFYEARRLEAEVRMEQARIEKDPRRAQGYLEAAGQAIALAARTAPSDPDLCDLESRRWWEEMELRRQAGLEIQDACAGLGRACDRWAVILPDSPDIDARRAWADLELARDMSHGNEASRLSWAADGMKLAELALGRTPEHPEALGALATALRIQAYSAMERGADPRPSLDRAIALLNRAIERTQVGYELLDQLAMAYWARIEYEKASGVNPTASLREAAEVMERMAGRFPRVADFEAYLGGFYVELGDFEATHGTDPSASVELAVARLNRAIRLLPHRFEFHFSLGNAYLTRAHYLLFHGGDPRLDLDKAESAYLKAQSENPRVASVLLGLAETQVIRSWALEKRHESPSAFLAQVERYLAEAGSIERPGWREAYYRSEAALVAALWNSDPEQAKSKFEEAERLALLALREARLQPPVHWLMAMIQKEWAARFPEEATHRTRLARIHFRKALELDPGFELARRG